MASQVCCTSATCPTRSARAFGGAERASTRGADELYDIFGKYGSIRQIRRSNGPETRGTSFVVYDDIYDARGLEV